MLLTVSMIQRRLVATLKTSPSLSVLMSMPGRTCVANHILNLSLAIKIVEIVPTTSVQTPLVIDELQQGDHRRD